ncbi:MAG: ABC transporter permease subunit, partial [Nitrospinota bacterium]
MANLTAVKGGPWLALRLRNLTLGHFLMAGVLAFACFIILYPLLTLIHGSFQKADSWGKPIAYTLSNYARLLEPRLLRSLWNTVVISLGTCAVATFFGVTLAWITARTNSFAAGAIEPLNLIPFYLSPLIGAIAWTFLASPSVGLLNQLGKALGLAGTLFNIYSITGIVWVMGLFYAPYMYLFTVGSLRKMDPALEEASRTAGSGVVGTTLRVTIPLTLPGILFGLSLTFVTSMGLFSVPATLGMPYKIEVFSTSVYNLIERDSPDFNMAAAFGMVVISATILLFFIQRKILLPREFTTVTGK